jgi:uncharacterized protein (DUF305 family)
MEKEHLYLAGGFVIGLLLTLAIVAFLPEGEGDESREPGMLSMNQMTSSLSAKSGAEFDKLFIELMIAHHEGAIEMAGLARQNSQRAEIKDLAGEIVSAQTGEVIMMKGWLADWFIE